jgi:hypothetical protein
MTAPLTVAGVLVAHALDYRIAHPSDHERERALAHSGHGYLEHLPSLAAVLAALVLVGAVVAAASRRMLRTPGPAVFAALGPLLFAIQEHVERIPVGAANPLHVIVERTFLVGLALQIPFALVAWAVARLLLAGARCVGRALRQATTRVRRPCSGRGTLLWMRPLQARLPALATCAPGRAPPAVPPAI